MRKTYIFFMVFILIGVIVNGIETAEDTDLSKRIIGTWCQMLGNEYEWCSTLVLNKDGTGTWGDWSETDDFRWLMTENIMTMTIMREGKSITTKYKVKLNLCLELTEDTKGKKPAIFEPMQALTDSLDYIVVFPFLIGDNFLTAAAHLCGQKVEGEKTDLIQVILHNKSTEEVRIKIKVILQGFSETAVDTVSIPPTQGKEVILTPSFKSCIQELLEQRPGNIYYSISDSKGNLLLEKTKKITLVSRNDIIWARPNWVGVFVTPNDKKVDKLITDAANRVRGRSMAGYGKDKDGVIEEVKAIYDTISKLGVHYRSATKSFFDIKSMVPQRVYFPAECIELTGANCIDGALLFASAFEKIGLQASIILVPGHAYVGVKLQKDQTSWLFIETTMVGTSDFYAAWKAGNKNYTDASQKKQVTCLDIKELREAGIKPFPFRIKD